MNDNEERKDTTNTEDYWKNSLKDVLTQKEISELTGISLEDLRRISERYPARIPRYYASLIKERGDAIFRQCMPSLEEIDYDYGIEDPLNEERGHDNGQSPKAITHRYSDRVLFLISNRCAMYCRFCTRKRKVGDPSKEKSKGEINEGIEYIQSHPEIRDVILSGGDPLMLEDDSLEGIIKRIREIKHVEIIRIGTRMPCTLPQRITPELASMLKKYHPLYVNMHFNHPNEITEESRRACNLLSEAGIPLGNQTVLLRGVNDSPEVMIELMQKLVGMRVLPYYLYQADLVKGTMHFKTKVETGIEIMRALRGTSGLCIPSFVIDTPGGKIHVNVEEQEIKDGKVVLKDFKGKTYEYPND